ncbi:MAG: DUF1353 domain-containing protein [Candidatus Sedimenticola sp. (ex Thyasira tokunagai)]
MKYSAPVTKFDARLPWQLPIWKLEDDLVCATGTVPAGFPSDGASVPLLFRWLFKPTGQLFYPAFKHDHDIKESKLPWVAAADNFRIDIEAMTTMHPARISMAYWGVRLYGVLHRKP